MATKKRKSSAAKKSSRRASTPKKTATKKGAVRKAPAKKSATRKSAAKKGAARKAPAKKSATRKSATKKAATRKSATKKAATRKSATKKVATRKSAATSTSARASSAKTTSAPASVAKKPTRNPTTPRSPPREDSRKTPEAPPSAEVIAVAWDERPATGSPFVEEVETSSAGIQPLAPAHAAVDELTSSGNELLDIFQRYDRNRTGSIERAEFARLLEALGQNVTDEELEIAVDIVDTDRTGKISWSQFKAWWTSR
ncbi:EF-hand domain-containing protein [Myxococcus qinghaiensis]|uniref:EF-hand domain-containing protein n=1 Tax=Myxococcus qinghaiensis TaxID=2906758 RepID=UPI0020A7E3B2|nr:EF-hand domain-containing protein [Myxococcus qinghaiensis]MCP3168734.1 histone H1-like repetitive region-containing protein [Myxococcus qinghaiensis]